ncbi:MAG: chemotaxis protein CheX [Syntrophobacteraceae bacterium]
MMVEKWEPVLRDVISEVLETMFFSMVEFEEEGEGHGFDYGSGIDIFNHNGRMEISLRVSREFARTITANLLGVNEDQVVEEDLEDTLKEFTNMVGGSYHARMKNSEWCLGIPRAWKIAPTGEAPVHSGGGEVHFGCFGESMGSALLEFIPETVQPC